MERLKVVCSERVPGLSAPGKQRREDGQTDNGATCMQLLSKLEARIRSAIIAKIAAKRAEVKARAHRAKEIERIRRELEICYGPGAYKAQRRL